SARYWRWRLFVFRSGGVQPVGKCQRSINSALSTALRCHLRFLSGWLDLYVFWTTCCGRGDDGGRSSRSVGFRTSDARSISVCFCYLVFGRAEALKPNWGLSVHVYQIGRASCRER